MRDLSLLTMSLFVLMLTGSTVAGQSVLDRTPNLSDGWVGSSGTLFFNFLHRFDHSGPPERNVSSAPTFLVAMGLPARTLAGFNYATSSDVAPGIPNEWEVFARGRPLSQGAGAPLDVSLQAGYNFAATSLDGQLALARWAGPVRLMAAVRGMSNGYYAGTARFGWAAGAGVRLTRFVVLAGDVASLVDRRAGEEIAWGAGVQLAIPYTPHTLSLHAANVNTTTLQGSSRGTRDVQYGFEFTIPITLRRYLRRSPPAAGEPSAAPGPMADVRSAGFDRGVLKTPDSATSTGQAPRRPAGIRTTP